MWINPFWEDDVEELVALMGPEHVIFGSDWPHMEGLPEPRGILEEIGGLDETAQDLFLRGNARRLNERC